mmetsp:Transcript_19608/g.29095  ORF Transcript_19608/g.29095 Transcript_19608/m.29095 type:complete len:245 (-) Transcript_19608:51-785(-)
MYSYGSSARAGGKRGHGGREYRPPKSRKDATATPPLLKECSCLLQFDLPEYATTSTRRRHTAIGGRERLQSLETELRSRHQVHLVVPGRNQKGPVAIVGASYRQAFPAAACFLKSLTPPSDTSTIPGRIKQHVQDPNDIIIEGHWNVPLATKHLHWVFRSARWSILVFFLPSSTNDLSNDSASRERKMLEMLNTCMDNVTFSTGEFDGVDRFTHTNPPIALASGTSQKLEILEDEIKKAIAGPS